MKIFVYFFLLIFPLILVSQDLNPVINFANNGFYLDISNKIEKNGFYKIFRKESRDTNFKEIAILKTPEKFESFYNALNLSNSKNPIYDFPEQTFLPRLWEIALKTKSLDSIPIYGKIPFFQEALGCGFYDNLVESGISYIYKIEFYRDNVLINEYTTQPITNKKTIPDCKIHFSSFVANDKYIKLNFASSISEKPFKIILFRNVYLQTDYLEIKPDILYNKLGDSIYARILDTNVVKGLIYDYYAIPLDLYGNLGVPSDTIRVVNSFNKSESYIQTIRTKSIDSLNAIQISWKCDVPQYLRSINIFRCTSYDGEYKLIGNALPTDTLFLDNQVNPIQTYFYYLVINDVFGESTRSPRATGMLQANKKAEIPLDFKVSNEGSNIKLTWRRPTSDTRGYYVFRTTAQENDTLRQISDLILNNDLEVSYVDTIKNINSPVFGYAIKSVNTSYDVSKPTEIEYINPQSNQTLPTPMNLRAINENGQILLTWDEALINNLEVKGYNVYRKLLKRDETDSTDFQKLPNLIENEAKNFYVDSTIVEGNYYLYSVESIGFNGNKSSLSAPLMVFLPKSKPISIQSIYTGVSDKGVLLQWDKTMQNSIVSYNIYRLKENEKPAKIASIKSDITEFFDNYPLDDAPIFYAITCVDAKGNESEIQEWTKISK